MIQDHDNSLDATPQSPCEGAIHNSGSKFFLDVPLVVGLSTSNMEHYSLIFTEYVGESVGSQCCQCKLLQYSLKCFQSGRRDHPAVTKYAKFSPRLKGTNPVACIHPHLALLGHCMTPDGAHKMGKARSP